MRNAMQLVQLADKFIEHGFKHGTTFSEERLAQIRRTAMALFNKAADNGLGRGSFGGPHGAANKSKYGYMMLEKVEGRAIHVSDYYDWCLEWVDHNTLHDPYEDMIISYKDYTQLLDDGCGWCMPVVHELLLKIRPPAKIKLA